LQYKNEQLSLKKRKKGKKKKKLCRPTVPNFFGDVSGNKEHVLRLKQNDHLCSVYHIFIHKVLVQHN